MPGARRVRRQLGRHALVLGQPDLRDPGLIACLERFAPDALLSWFWPKRIPSAVLRLPRLGAYGVHPSLLPRWRGPDPYFWALYAGDHETGVSLHLLEDEYDTGAVVMQSRLRIAAHDDAWSLARRLDRLSLPLLVEAARQLAAEAAPLAALPQPSEGVSAAPRPEAHLLEVDWHASADDILRLVRAAAPYPGATAELGDQQVELLRAQRSPRKLPRALQPAEAVWVDERVVVQSGDGGVMLERVRTDAGEVLSGAAIASLFDAALSRF
jgi:methionyl-tRNA formyltransferase